MNSCVSLTAVCRTTKMAHSVDHAMKAARTSSALDLEITSGKAVVQNASMPSCRGATRLALTQWFAA
ncbi:hypothetical protein GCK32_018449 [Trichostrongylus colubriformis]|uniref:Uncharacterized protein n=1 Tax=Trichostrongylus colubriformis TaxID=6319 RepID=A0AAN8EU27_TRICO